MEMHWDKVQGLKKAGREEKEVSCGVLGLQKSAPSKEHFLYLLYHEGTRVPLLKY